MTGGRCSEVDLVLKLLGRVLEWSLLTGGRYSEVVVNTGLTVFQVPVKGLQVLVPGRVPAVEKHWLILLKRIKIKKGTKI